MKKIILLAALLLAALFSQAQTKFKVRGNFVEIKYNGSSKVVPRGMYTIFEDATRPGIIVIANQVSMQKNAKDNQNVVFQFAYPCDSPTAVSKDSLITALGAIFAVPAAGGTGANVNVTNSAITVNPGNSANTTAWKVTGTGGTFPSTQSGTWNAGLSAGYNHVGKVRVDTLPALAAGSNAIGSITNTTFGASSGYAHIGKVRVDTLPALATGSNAIGSITNTSFSSTQSGTWTTGNSAGYAHIGTVKVDTLPALPTGANTIGSISNVSGTVSLPTGASTSALQSTGNTTLSSISGGIPSTASIAGGCSFSNITSNATTTVKSGQGTLYAFWVNGLGTGETIVIYNSTTGSGAVIGTYTPTLTGPLIYIPCGINCNIGVTVVTSGSAAGNWTAYYK